MDTVDYVKPADVAIAMVETGRRKLTLAPRDLLAFHPRRRHESRL